MRRLWLWETAAYLGVTDDEGRAIARASECVCGGGTARVELAFLSASFDALTCSHIRTGVGWTATAPAAAAGPRPLRWQPIVPDPGAGNPGSRTENRR